MNAVALMLCARQELLLATRSRWTQLFALAFAALALAVASSGYILSGGYGVQDFSRTAVSLVQLILLLVPLASLLLGVLSLAPERGGAEILFSQPASRTAILAGQCLGLFAALVAAEAVGLGLAGLVIFGQAGDGGAAGFLFLLGCSALLTAIFLSLAALLAAGAVGRKRLRALALALVVWFAIIVLYDVTVLGIASFLPSGPASKLLVVSVLVNPADAVRTGALLALEGTSAFGAASLAFLRFTGGSGVAAFLLGVSACLWIALPFAWAAHRMHGADL